MPLDPNLPLVDELNSILENNPKIQITHQDRGGFCTFRVLPDRVRRVGIKPTDQGWVVAVPADAEENDFTVFGEHFQLQKGGLEVKLFGEPGTVTNFDFVSYWGCDPYQLCFRFTEDERDDAKQFVVDTLAALSA